jgi:cellulose synthase/poly-beta-1,6-N-acetylglucosamine synthase-like glycosyltransferase
MENELFPEISVLVAARNEEANIAACLDALIAQDYPAEKLEIWVGDDQSEDRTAAIVAGYAQRYPNVHLFSVETCVLHQKGKSNVLAQLAHQAKGEFLFITDADVTLGPLWLKTMLPYFTDQVGVITGVVATKGNSLFAKLQNAEWLFYMAHGHRNFENGKPVTAVGGNMAVKTSAYWQTGGYEHIPFSVTEDLELFKEIRKKGFTFQSVFNAEVLGYTNPLLSFSALIKQRRRWFTGALQLPLIFSAGLLFSWSLLLILLIVAAFVSWKVAVFLFFVKWMLDIGFLIKTYRQLHLKADAGVWLYWPCSMVFNTLLLILQLMPGAVEWKGRKYEEKYVVGDRL